LHDLGDGRNTLNKREHFFFSTDSTLLEWYFVELTEDAKYFPVTETLRDRDLAIIASCLPTIDLREIALFVAIRKNYGGIRYVDILNRVWITREERQEMLVDWSRMFREGFPEVMSAGEKLPPNEKWCVDGPSQPSEPAEDPMQLSEAGEDTNGLPNALRDPKLSHFRRALTSWGPRASQGQTGRSKLLFSHKK